MSDENVSHEDEFYYDEYEESILEESTSMIKKRIIA